MNVTAPQSLIALAGSSAKEKEKEKEREKVGAPTQLAEMMVARSGRTTPSGQL